jgi:CubicO group peptidase (beta-lactamase class C family)
MISDASSANPLNLPQETEKRLDQILQTAVETGATAGVEALVSAGDEVVYHKACGFLRRIPLPILLKPGAFFDLASLTKVVCTTTSVMILVDQGRVRLDAPVWSYIPEFGCKGKEKITVRHLLTHLSGLPAFIQFYKDLSGKKAFYEALAGLEIQRQPGVQREYSDLGFMTLGWLVERVSGKSLDWFAKERIFAPLGMRNTLFKPPRSLWRKCAATEDCPFRKRVMQGEVHDENAYQMGGVSGHAGLFSTADDLSLFARMMLHEGTYHGNRWERMMPPPALSIPPTLTLPRKRGGDGQILSQATFREMLKPQPMPQGTRQALGWWFRKPAEEATVFLPSDHSYGHTGFTGTSLWIDPDYHVAVILLANAIHPKRETANAAAFRKPFHTVISEWCTHPSFPDGKGNQEKPL